MKACPYCAETIQDAAIVCRYCGRDLSTVDAQARVAQTVKQRQTQRKILGRGWLILLGLVLFGVVYGISMSPMHTSSEPGPTLPVATSQPAAPADALALLSSRGYEADGGGYNIVEGQVRNLSGQPMRHVTAHASWYDGHGDFITADDAVIDLDPILPDQISSFKTMSRSNPAMAKYTVEFKYLIGGSISFRDDRKRTKKPAK
jgi:hypothetical protein